jgi:hypothetical protein
MALRSKHTGRGIRQTLAKTLLLVSIKVNDLDMLLP